MTNFKSEKRYAKPGDRIVIVKQLSNVVEKGDIFPVEAVDKNGNASVDFGSYWASPVEYEVVTHPTTRAEYWADKRRAESDDIAGTLGKLTPEQAAVVAGEDDDRLYNVKLYTVNANYHVLLLDDETLALLESDLGVDVAENFAYYYCHDAECVVGVRLDAVELYTVKEAE